MITLFTQKKKLKDLLPQLTAYGVSYEPGRVKTIASAEPPFRNSTENLKGAILTDEVNSRLKEQFI